MDDIYCLKCKKRTTTKKIEKTISKNKRPLLKGICAICGKKKSVFLKKAF